MSQTSLCIDPRAPAYSYLPDYDDAVASFFGLPEQYQSEILGDCQALIQKHSLHEVVAIDLKHKHFDLDEGHVLVEKQITEPPCSTMAPTLVDEFKETVTPFSFALVDDVWAPYEFVADCDAAVEGLMLVSDQAIFLSELAETLKKHGVSNVLGFHILHRDHLGKEARGTIETPGASDTELLLRPYTEDLYHELRGNGGHQVMWSWCQKKAPIGHHCLACSHNCGTHCSSHCKGH